MLPQADAERPHGLKYSLFYGRPGERVIGYDNERGKGDHRRYRGIEERYAFRTLDKLLIDFRADVAAERNAMSEFKLRVESPDDFFERAHWAAKRIDAGDYDVREFGMSFTTPQQMFELLNANRWQLLSTLQRHGAWSIRALAGALGRDYKAVHTDVTKLIEAGLIERDGEGLISVPWTRITAELGHAEAA